MNIKTIRAAVMLPGVVASQAWAGRPLGTDDAATADALGTALMVMGPEEAKAWLGQHTEVDAYLIIDDGRGGYASWSTPGWPSK